MKTFAEKWFLLFVSVGIIVFIAGLIGLVGFINMAKGLSIALMLLGVALITIVVVPWISGDNKVKKPQEETESNEKDDKTKPDKPEEKKKTTETTKTVTSKERPTPWWHFLIYLGLVIGIHIAIFMIRPDWADKFWQSGWKMIVVEILLFFGIFSLTIIKKFKILGRILIILSLILFWTIIRSPSPPKELVTITITITPHDKTQSSYKIVRTAYVGEWTSDVEIPQNCHWETDPEELGVITPDGNDYDPITGYMGANLEPGTYHFMAPG